MRKKVLATVMAGAMCASMVIPAFAATGGEAVPYSDGTEVYAGIVINDPDARIKVEVPTLFAFVVNGSVTADTSAVTAADGDILLPNVKVHVTTPSVQDPTTGAVTTAGEYEVQTVGSGNLKFANYSTRASVADDDTALVVEDRIGLDVKLEGSIKNEGTEASRNYWTHVANADDASMQGATAGFKKYTLAIGERDDGSGTMVPNKFDVMDNGALKLNTQIALAAPDLTVTGVDTTSKLAASANAVDADFNVFVGGQKGQYKQVEESAKVGTIVWTISADVLDTENVVTAPDADLLQ